MTTPRRLHAHCLWIAALALFATTACGPGDPGAPGLGSAYLSAELVAPDGGAARGRLSAMLVSWLRQIDVSVSGLEASASYEVTADGLVVASFITNVDGSGNVGIAPDGMALDPRNRVFAVRVPDGEDVLVMSDPDATSGATVIAEHSPLTALVGGDAAVTFGAYATGERRFWLELLGVAPGEYTVWIDGTPRATIDATSGAGVATFSSAPGIGELLLDFDPRLATIEVLLGDEYVFAGTGHAEILGLDVCLRSSGGQPLIAQAAGFGRATLSTGTDCQRNFTVTIGSVPMSSYEVLVDGVVRGSILVGETEYGATHGELRFSSRSSDGGTPLDFDPLGKSIEVRESAALYFSLDAFTP